MLYPIQMYRLHLSSFQQENTEEELVEVEADVELSALVNYIQPVHFHGFEFAEGMTIRLEIKILIQYVILKLLLSKQVYFQCTRLRKARRHCFQ